MFALVQLVREAGPGNYKTGNEFELLSESPSRRGEVYGS